MLTRGSFCLVALLVSALALPASVPASAGGFEAAKVGLKNRRKLKRILRQKGLAKLPSVAGALTEHAKRRKGHMTAEVTGTPPPLVEIGSASVKNVFWRPGVVDAIVGGAASPEQCSEFRTGQTDGQSGGLGACHMAEGVGYSLGDILSGDTSLCYMKRFPTRANLEAGAITLVAGNFPGDDPSRLFSVPAGDASRIVKVNVSGQQEGQQTVFLRVHGEHQNQSAGDLYAVDLWYCRGEPQPKGVDHIHITTAGEFSAEENQQHDADAYAATVTGFVTFTNGEIVYDTTRSRTAVVASARDSGAYKAQHEIRPDNTIASRSYDSFGSGTRRSYIVAAFSGTGFDNLRFLAGAFKERQSGGPVQPDVVGGTEYRSTYYAASPGTALESALGDVSFDDDPFYATPPSVSVDTTGYACDEAADVEVAIDFANPAGAALQARCEGRRYDQLHFCEEDPAVHAADLNYGPACFGPH